MEGVQSHSKLVQVPVQPSSVGRVSRNSSKGLDKAANDNSYAHHACSLQCSLLGMRSTIFIEYDFVIVLSGKGGQSEMKNSPYQPDQFHHRWIILANTSLIDYNSSRVDEGEKSI